MSDERLELIYAEAVKAVDGQQFRLHEIRGRSVSILTAASISAAFIVGRVDHGLATAFGTGAFLCLGLVTAGLLIPIPGWRFVRDARSILEDYLDATPPADIDELRRQLAEHLDDDYQENERRLKWLIRGLVVAALLLVAEITALAVAT